jgi:5-methylcytosine-specific restriction endonuclease McrA
MADVGLIRFAEKVLELLDEGQFTSTYKYAVVLGLLDLSLENVDRAGEPPTTITTVQLADRVIELYWPHAMPFGSEGDARVLRQNAGRDGSQAEIVRLIQEFRGYTAEYATGSLVQLRHRAAPAFERLRAHVEWKLIQMPLPRAQLIGRTDDTFLYAIAWGTDVKQAEVRAYQRGAAGSFDNRIHLRPGVGEFLIQLNGLIRPLIHRQWAAMVARLNRMEEARLERFLFGTDRNPLNAVRPGLLDMQRGSCFYCGGRLRGAMAVDHFIPWSRYPEDGLGNLVLTHAACNGDKRDFLAATPHVVRWADRLSSGVLQDLQAYLRWDAAVEEIRGVARGIYLRLPPDAMLWVMGGDFDRPRPKELGEALRWTTDGPLPSTET